MVLSLCKICISQNCLSQRILVLSIRTRRKTLNLQDRPLLQEICCNFWLCVVLLPAMKCCSAVYDTDRSLAATDHIVPECFQSSNSHDNKLWWLWSWCLWSPAEVLQYRTAPIPQDCIIYSNTFGLWKLNQY